MSDARYVRVARLIGAEVLAPNNQRVGRLEEIRTREDGCTVDEYVIGMAGMLERLHLSVRAVLGLKRGGGYLARWDQVDISDPEKPRLTCPVDELRKA